MIVCLSIPHFAAAVERRIAPALATIPLVISESSETVARVFAVSIEAAGYGIVPGMSLGQAFALYPHARIIPTNPVQYQQTLNEILTLLATLTPKVEPEVSQSTAVIYSDFGELSGTEQLDLAGYITQEINTRVNLVPTLGLAIGKFPAYIAANSIGLNRVLLIAPGEEISFLAPLPATYLPLDRELARRFRLLGLRTMGQFAGLPAGAVLTQFGKYGCWLHQLAQGRDDRPILPYQSQPTEQITRQLDGPVADRVVLTALGQMLVEELAPRLEIRGQVAQGLHLILHLEDETKWEKQLTLRQPTNSREQLGRGLAALIERAQVSCGVVGLTVKLTGLIPVNPKQLDLFVNPTLTEQEIQFDALLPNLVTRYGPACFYDTTLTNPLAHLPERRFQLRAMEGR